MKILIKILFCISTLVYSNFSIADKIIISFGTSLTSDNLHSSLGEYKNHSENYNIKYEGIHYGIRLDHSVKGDDNGNTYITVDSLYHFNDNVFVGAGIMVAKNPLRKVGSYMNFHATLGLESDIIFPNKTGVGIYYDHWSNGHIHSIFGEDNVPNPPRNIISVGIFKSF